VTAVFGVRCLSLPVRAAWVTAVAALVVGVLGACSGDGRELRDPTFPLPPTTTTLPEVGFTPPSGP
jgi:hypothetical protein